MRTLVIALGFTLLFALATSTLALAQDWTADEMRQEKQAYREFILLRQTVPAVEVAPGQDADYLDYLVSFAGGDPAVLELAELRLTKLEHRAFVVDGYLRGAGLAGGER